MALTTTTNFTGTLAPGDTMAMKIGRSDKFPLRYPFTQRRFYKRGFCIITRKDSSSLRIRKLVVRNANSKKPQYIPPAKSIEEDWDD